MYSMVAREDAAQDVSVITSGVSSRPTSPKKAQGEIGGTGTEEELPPRPKMFHISVADMKQDTTSYCEKSKC